MLVTVADNNSTVVSAPTNAPTAVGVKSTLGESRGLNKSDAIGNVAIAAGPGTNAVAAAEDEYASSKSFKLYERSKVNNPWAGYYGRFSASDQVVTEGIRSFQDWPLDEQRSYIKDFFDRGETPYPYLLNAAQKAGIVDDNGKLLPVETPGRIGGAVLADVGKSIENPQSVKDEVKSDAAIMSEARVPVEVPSSSTDDKSKLIKDAQALISKTGQNNSSSTPRPASSGGMGTSISGPIDDFISSLFDASILATNNLNKLYPMSYVA